MIAIFAPLYKETNSTNEAIENVHSIILDG
jgi:hypothetical protein